MFSIEDYQDRIASIDREIESLEDRRRNLQDERDDCQKKIRELERVARTDGALSSIFDCNESNSMRVSLSKSTKTIDLMERFYSSDKAFLVFSHILYMETSFGWRAVSLVVVKAKDHMGIEYKSSGMKMTDLKKAVGGTIRAGKYTKDDRVYALFEELLAIQDKVIEPGMVVPFNNPCFLGGKTDKDTYGFGTTYSGPYMTSQKQYGEVTGFYVIGVIVR